MSFLPGHHPVRVGSGERVPFSRRRKTAVAAACALAVLVGAYGAVLWAAAWAGLIAGIGGAS